METNINISTINKYFFYNKEQSSNKYRTKITNYSHFSLNEANICHKISKIPYYTNFFSILKDYECLNISQLNEDIIEKLKNIEEINYYLFKYDDKNSIDFTDYLYSYKSVKKLIHDIINIFPHILSGLYTLNENNICFFNILPQNMIFHQNYREKPVLTNFSMSLQLNKLDYTYISHFLNKLDNFTYQPLEINILFYFINHDITTISYSFIEEFCENYIENLNILRLFSENYKKIYKEQCIETMKKYINKPKNYIINDILERNNKWDVYGISLLYVQIFGCISRVFSLKGSFITKITLELSKNLHPNSDKRMSLERTIEQFNSLLNEQTDWSFVNNLDNKKIEQLFEEISK
jgi:hypothetical protein